MIRTLHPELLDTLPAHDVGAIHSRRDLRRLNTLMGHAPIFARTLQELFPQLPPTNILEIGAGDGQLLLNVACRLDRWIQSQGNQPPKSSTQFLPLPQGEGRGEGEESVVTATTSVHQARPTSLSPRVNVLFIDLQNLLHEETKSQFAALNWHVRSVESDIFHWLKTSTLKSDVILANLVLHHFTDSQLTLLFSEIAKRADAFIAVEPRRSRWPLFCTRLLGLIGCNAVTRHDAPVSVRAGFNGRELSALWPHNNEWELTEQRAGWFSHQFVARRRA